MSSRADIPRSFGGPGERCRRIFRRSRLRQSRRSGWGAWLRPAHCHPVRGMERYLGARRHTFLRAALLSLRCPSFKDLDRALVGRTDFSPPVLVCFDE